ncbi:MAG: hypothetical protein DMG99_17560 [Acidobacteria bacterium]|nr:MAG: hypothetical protein DMG99_17560 [Acidobacteriota bacterium]
MYPDLQKELATFERRTPKSAEAHKKNLKRIPLGVASNYRAYDPWPIFVKEASGSKFRDLDGNEYIDHNLTFGALMAGHCHPAVMKAVEKRLLACRTTWNGNWQRKFATAFRLRCAGLATAGRKRRCMPFVLPAPLPDATRS